MPELRHRSSPKKSGRKSLPAFEIDSVHYTYGGFQVRALASWKLSTMYHNLCSSNIFTQWTLGMAYVTIVLLLSEGFNSVTAFVSSLIAVVGVACVSHLRCSGSKLRFIRVFIAKFLTLYSIMVSKTCARVAGNTIDERSITFLLLSSDEKADVMGDFFDPLLIARGLLRVFVESSGVTFIISLFVVISAKKLATVSSFLVNFLKMLSPGFGIVAMFMFMKLGQTKGCDTLFAPPPSLNAMKHKPNIVVLLIDSLRADMYTDETFPLTRKELMGHGNGDSCVKWHQHDAGATDSDTGFATLFYTMPSPSVRHLYQYKANPSIKSWPMETLRAQGYDIYRNAPYEYNFCWGMMEHCDLHFRGLNFVVNDLSNSTNLINMRKLLTEKSESRSSNPFMYVLDFQDVRYPYSKTPEALDNLSYFEPALSEDETYALKQDLVRMSDETANRIRPKLFNRVKNSMIAFDSHIAAFVRAIRHIRDDTFVILTADHGELLMEGKPLEISHLHDDPNDSQRRVPFVMCGPSNIIQDLRVPNDLPTMHTDVFPSILEAFGAKLGDEWKSLPGFRSHFQYGKDGKHPEGFTFAQNQWSENKVVRLGNKRVAMKWATKHVTSAQNIDTGESLTESEIKMVKDQMLDAKGYSWPGVESKCAQDDEAKTDDLFEDLPDDGTTSVELNRTVSFIVDRDSVHHAREPKFHTRGNGDTSNSSIIIDILSIGSLTRPDYLRAQQQTWAMHLSVREFWGFTETEDFDPTCCEMSQRDAEEYVARCRDYGGWGWQVKHFVEAGYAITEGMSREEAGWVCAQRRLGRGLGWLQTVYAERGTPLPDFLLIVDDDSYVDLEQLEALVERSNISVSTAQVYGPCMFRTGGYIKWDFAYGGFSTLITRAALSRMLRPIACKNNTAGNDEFSEAVCKSIRRSRIGEGPVFQEGMSVAELFRDYSATELFCMHSDWLNGYMAQFYMLSENRNQPVHAIWYWPEQCGNVTMNCQDGSDFCHRVRPALMESLTNYTYNKNPDKFRAPPVLLKSEH